MDHLIKLHRPSILYFLFSSAIQEKYRVSHLLSFWVGWSLGRCLFLPHLLVHRTPNHLRSYAHVYCTSRYISALTTVKVKVLLTDHGFDIGIASESHLWWAFLYCYGLQTTTSMLETKELRYQEVFWLLNLTWGNFFIFGLMKGPYHNIVVGSLTHQCHANYVLRQFSIHWSEY